MKKSVLMLLLLVINFATQAAVDSIGVEKSNSGNFILHKVEKSEGLYAIARKYHTTATDIQNANNLTNTSLQLGQVLKVPTSQNIVIVKQNISKQNKSNTHTVKPGETLLAICRTYNLTLSEIKTLNDLTDLNLKVGQVLVLSEKQKPTVKTEKPIETVVNKKNEPKIISEVKPAEKEIPAPTITAKNYTYENSKEMNESGLAGWINDKNANPKKSVALHKTAVIGTIMKVTNPASGKMVYVKIIGTLPNNDENENLVILLSKAAASLIDATEPKFKVNLTYSAPK